ncbi:hypothetical protein KUV95_17315 [Microbulbifer agarilyticus]|uniref:hypothetical protein n=1 Tax=Microbulbifer agarilyticus TaxID=260552 RepID=UPI001C9785BD|nr:hypothetical protein [Microbulbifer agarilyticus]MBY6213304.1 hypothetical protein [Microbulbifer agarilyticus]
MHVLRWSLRSHFRAKSAQGKLPLLAALLVPVGIFLFFVVAEILVPLNSFQY